MSSPILNSKRMILTIVVLAALFLTACNTGSNTQSKTFTIGIARKSAALDGAVAGFKAGLADLGYVEGKNVVYQDAGLFKNPNDLEPAIQKLVAAKVDMIFAPGTASDMAKKATAGTDIAVVSAQLVNPVESGLVQSITNPGGNVTGVMTTTTSTARVLEYLKQIFPNAKRVVLICDPTGIAASYLPPSKEVAAKLGLELVIKEIHSDDEAAAAIGNLPTDVDAVYNLPDPFVGSRVPELIKASLARKLPLVSYDVAFVEAGALLAYGFDAGAQGKQAAGLAGKIFKGAKPASLPIEIADYQLSLNLKTAQAIGATIPETLLRQSTTIIR